MRKIANTNDWWDWGVILLIVAVGTIVLWAGVWAGHSWASTSDQRVVAKSTL